MKRKKNHETTQQHNAVVLNDIYHKKIKKTEKKKQKIKVKAEKKEKKEKEAKKAYEQKKVNYPK